MQLSDGVHASYEQGLMLAPWRKGMESLTKSNNCNPLALIYQEQNESAVSPCKGTAWVTWEKNSL